jgi:hypothetical protein
MPQELNQGPIGKNCSANRNGLLRDNLGEKAATIWMGIGGRGLRLIVAN